MSKYINAIDSFRNHPELSKVFSQNRFGPESNSDYYKNGAAVQIYDVNSNTPDITSGGMSATIPGYKGHAGHGEMRAFLDTLQKMHRGKNLNTPLGYRNPWERSGSNNDNNALQNMVVPYSPENSPVTDKQYLQDNGKALRVVSEMAPCGEGKTGCSNFWNKNAPDQSSFYHALPRAAKKYPQNEKSAYYDKFKDYKWKFNGIGNPTNTAYPQQVQDIMQNEWQPEYKDYMNSQNPQRNTNTFTMYNSNRENTNQNPYQLPQGTDINKLTQQRINARSPKKIFDIKNSPPPFNYAPPLRKASFGLSEYMKPNINTYNSNNPMSVEYSSSPSSNYYSPMSGYESSPDRYGILNSSLGEIISPNQKQLLSNVNQSNRSPYKVPNKRIIDSPDSSNESPVKLFNLNSYPNTPYKTNQQTILDPNIFNSYPNINQQPNIQKKPIPGNILDLFNEESFEEQPNTNQPNNQYPKSDIRYYFKKQ